MSPAKWSPSPVFPDEYLKWPRATPDVRIDIIEVINILKVRVTGLAPDHLKYSSANSDGWRQFCEAHSGSALLPVDWMFSKTKDILI